MLRKILSFLVLIFIVFFYFINLPSLTTATKLQVIASIENKVEEKVEDITNIANKSKKTENAVENKNIIENTYVKQYDKSFEINNTIYWNRLNKIAKINKNFKISFINYDNSYFYTGKDFFLSKQGSDFYIIGKKNEASVFLASGQIALTDKDSNLFAILQNNGLEISFYQFIPLQDRAIELKKEVFSSFYTSFDITRNSFYFSLMNGNCYIYNPFESISIENLVENSPFIYSISANSSSNDYVIICEYKPQKLLFLNKNGNILFSYIFEKIYTLNFSYLLENQLLLIKNTESIKILKLNEKKKEINQIANLNIKGEVLDLIEFFSYIILIISDGDQYFLVFYDIDSNSFFKKSWKQPIYQLEIIDSNGIFSVYNENSLWILSLKQELK